MILRAAAAALALLLGVAGCDGDDASARWSPAVGDTWHLQLQGPLVTDVDVYDVDLFDTPAATIASLQRAGRHVVCYVNVGAWEEWRRDAGSWPESVLGSPLEGWPGERWIDVRALSVVAPLIEARFDRAAAKGCDGVDPDNVDGYQADTGFPIRPGDSREYVRFLIDAAHARGLSIGLKNAPALVPAFAGSVDFAVNEQCIAFDECSVLQPLVDADVPVFGVEYEGSFASVCAAAEPWGSWLLADVALDGRAQVCR